MRLCTVAAALFLAGLWPTAWGQLLLWNGQPGLAADISGNQQGDLWAIGIERVNESGYQALRFDSQKVWARDDSAPPGRRIAVGPKGEVWILNDGNNLYRYAGGFAQPVGQANDVAVGADGSVWIIGTSKVPGGFDIHKWNGSGWTNVPGGAVRIAVEKDGTPWVVNDVGQVFRFNAAVKSFNLKPGKAHSVHTGASGAVWMLGTDSIVGGFPIYQWNPATQEWDSYASYGAVAITEVSGTPWIVQSGGALLSKDPFTLTPIETVTIGGTPTLTMPPMTPQAQTPPWVQTAGKLLCVDTGAECGTTNADFVGGYTLDTTCDEGFYDMIYGGTCWKCPDDTDDRGAWLRSGDPVDKDTACWRIPKERTGKAIKVKSPAWAWDCPSGSFWDGHSPDGIGGSCWKCPDDLPRRTLAAVWADNACASTLNETKPAILLSFNGCPTPNAETMGLAGKRIPGKPFLDIAAGAGNGYAAGCFACPVTDEQGNILIAARNANPLYDRTNNGGCDIQLKWQPPPFPEPGLAYMEGVKRVIWDHRLFEGDRITAYLYDLAEAKGLGDATPAAKEWVAEQWAEIAAKPYNSETFRALIFTILKAAVQKAPEQRSPGEQTLIDSFASYIQRYRTYLAQQGLAMYDRWKAYDDSYRAQTSQTKSLSSLFYYGTVPFDFHSTISTVMGLGSTAGGMLGVLASANAFMQGVQFVKQLDHAGNLIKFVPVRSTHLFGLTQGLNIFKSVQGLTAVSGATIISAVGIILSSIAMDQLMAIETARPRLEASLAEAQKPVDLSVFRKEKNGEDMLYYYWAKAMDTVDLEDPQVVQLAGQSYAVARQSGFPAPPKQLIEVTWEWVSAGSAISSGTGAASPFSGPGLEQGEMLVSPHEVFQAKMQPDGNFVIYANGAPIWATNTNGQANPPYRLAMQPDGNLVLYGSQTWDVTLSGYGTCKAGSPCSAIWSTGPRGGTAPYSLEMQDDGNLVIYDSTHTPVWASNTAR